MAIKKKRTEKKDTEKVTEVFDIKKGEKEEEIVVEGKEKVPSGIEEKKDYNKVLKNILIGVGFFIIAFIAVILLAEASKHFTYEGLEFEKVKAGEITFYKTQFPTYINGEWKNFNLYVRTNPKDLDKIPFEGERINLKDVLVLNVTDDFQCGGAGVISIANLAQFLQDGLAVDVVQDKNATCDPQGRYIFLEIDPSNETKIVQNSQNCYTIHISNCEILEGTEKFIVEDLIELKAEAKKQASN
ncbi:Uncharacterised protein [uncultured archaeon]|nr:Uncharacterised protein [uncultured archaeon]